MPCLNCARIIIGLSTLLISGCRLIYHHLLYRCQALLLRMSRRRPSWLFLQRPPQRRPPMWRHLLRGPQCSRRRLPVRSPPADITMSQPIVGK